jgi:hypothetical protein
MKGDRDSRSRRGRSTCGSQAVQELDRNFVLEPGGLNVERVHWLSRGDGSPSRALAVRANAAENSSSAPPKGDSRTTATEQALDT